MNRIVAALAALAALASAPPSTYARELQGAFRREGGTIRNWNGVVGFRTPAQGVHAPRTIEDLVRIVKDSRKVRVVGSGHSMNASVVPAPGGALVQMGNLARIGAVEDHGDGTGSVWVEAGVTLRDLSEGLARRGWAVETLPQSSKITLGGALNGIHGSTLQHPATLAEQVTGMELISSAGEQVSVPHELLPLARVHLGVLGAVSRVRLRVVPNFNLRRTDDEVSAKVALAPKNIRKSLAEHPYAREFTYDPTTNKVVRRFLDVSRGAMGAESRTEFVSPSLLSGRIAFGVASLLPGALGRLADRWIRYYSVRPITTPIHGESRFMFMDVPDHPVHDTSYGIPLEDAQAAVQRIREEFAAIGYEPPLPLSIRFLGGTDQTRLAMNSGRDTAVIEMVQPVQYDRLPGKRALSARAREVFRRILSTEFGGRPHWQKEFTARPQAVYPAHDWQAFGALRTQWGRKFSNDWSDAVAPR